MSKKEAKIELKLIDDTRDGDAVTVLVTGKNELGYIKEVGDHFEVYAAGTKVPVKVKTQKDAENELIMHYNLHQG